MKKFTLFMLAACAWFTASTSAMADSTEPTVAESPTAASSLTSGYYVVKAHVKSTEGYLYHVSSDNNGRPFHIKPTASMGDVLTTLSSNTAYVWYVNTSSDGTFTLQNLNSGDYIPAQNSNNGNMATGVAPHTFANAAILKPQTYSTTTPKGGTEKYTALDGGTLLACTNYTEIERQIHCNTDSEHNLSYWASDNFIVDGTGSLTEFAFYAINDADFTTAEANIQKGTILAVTETEGSTVTKWAGVSGETYTLHTSTTSTSTETQMGFAYSGSITTTVTKSVSPTNFTISETNNTFTITSSSSTTNTVTANSEVFGKYYRIGCARKSDMSNRLISAEGNTVSTDGVLTGAGSLIRKATTDEDLPQIWQLEQADATKGTVRFKNVNTDGYMSGNCSAIKLNTSSNAGSYTIIAGTGKFSGYDSSTQFELCDVNGNMLNANGGPNNTNFGAWNDKYDSGSYWEFEEVTTVPVTIDATASYATVGMPFAVQVPEGVTAYTAESATGGYITLKEITSKVIPANTGAILYKDGGGDVTLTITTDPNTEVGTNILTATTAKRTGYTSGDTYVLALNSESKAAFLKSELTVVPANKAYIAASALTESGSNVLNFNFGGDVTGIHSLDAADGTSAPTAYYDLNGRRVLYPAHGIFVTAKGKKVLVK